MSDTKDRPEPRGTGSPRKEDLPGNPPVRRSRFGAASEGWEAYSTWLDRVRQQPGPVSRQAVIAKSLYSISSYKSWAGKARGAFDKPK